MFYAILQAICNDEARIVLVLKARFRPLHEYWFILHSVSGDYSRNFVIARTRLGENNRPARKAWVIVTINNNNLMPFFERYAGHDTFLDKGDRETTV